MNRATKTPSRVAFCGPNRLARRMRLGWGHGPRQFQPVVTALEDRRLLALITLASFSVGNGGYDPDSLVVDCHGNIYGTAEGALGTVFELASGSNTIKTWPQSTAPMGMDQSTSSRTARATCTAWPHWAASVHC
jgi:hypothetical protein